MSGERVELRRIENLTDREKIFYERRNDLFLKACELAVLCDAEVALIVFSCRGKLYEFGSDGISKTLERYQLCTYNAQATNVINHEAKEP